MKTALADFFMRHLQDLRQTRTVTFELQSAAVSAPDPSADIPCTLVVVSVLLIALGVAVRAVHFWSGRSLWLDEVLLALNLCSRGFIGLTRPLEHNQGAPVGFLWLERSCIVLFGTGERSLRLPSFAASLLIIPLIFQLAWREVGKAAAWIGTAALAVMPALLYFSAETKQYALDTLVCFAVFSLAAKLLPDKASRTGLIAYAAVCTLAVWFSYPSIFFVIGTGLVLLTRAFSAREGMMVKRLVAVGALSLASVLASYIVSSRFVAANPGLRAFWSSTFPTVPPRSANDLRQYVTCFMGYFEVMFTDYLLKSFTGTRMAVYAAVLAVLGAHTLRRNNRALMYLILVPLALGVLAAVLHRYPIQGRLALYASVPLTLLCATTIAESFKVSNKESSKESSKSHFVGWALFIAFMLLPTMEAGAVLTQHPARVETRACLEVVAREAIPGDSLYVYWEARPVVEFYQTYLPSLALPNVRIVAGESPSLNAVQWVDHESSHLTGRVWTVFSHVHDDAIGNEETLLVFELTRRGRCVSSQRFAGATLYLFDFTTPATAVPPI